MDAETLGGDFYRERARLCHALAEAAAATKPLFARLASLANEYEKKAQTADLCRRSSDRLIKSPNGAASFVATAG
jgi:hypothetical protein